MNNVVDAEMPATVSFSLQLVIKQWVWRVLATAKPHVYSHIITPFLVKEWLERFDPFFCNVANVDIAVHTCTYALWTSYLYQLGIVTYLTAYFTLSTNEMYIYQIFNKFDIEFTWVRPSQGQSV